MIDGAAQQDNSVPSVEQSKSCKFHSIGSAKADPYRVQNIVESCRGEPWLARTNTEIRYFVMIYLYSHYLLALTFVFFVVKNL